MITKKVCKQLFLMRWKSMQYVVFYSYVKKKMLVIAI